VKKVLDWLPLIRHKADHEKEKQENQSNAV